MKTIKYIFAIICLFSLCGGVFSSCADEFEKKDNAGTGIANSLQLQLTIPDNKEIAPMSKSSQSDSEGVTDLAIFIYNVSEGTLAEHYYYPKDKLQGLTTDEKFIKIGLTQVAPGQKRVFLIANVGGEAEYNTLCGLVGTEDQLKAYSVGLNGAKPPMLLAGQGDQDFDAKTGAQVSASLKRIYSMITVKVVRNLSNGLVINPKSVQLKHVPTTGFLFKDNKIESEDQCKIDAEKIERTDGETDFLTDEHTKAPALYLFENRQPEGSNAGSQTTKTPAGLKPDALIESIKTDRKCSYIEVVADYLKGGQSGVAGSGTIIYRFFLGKDATTDFDVERNVHYKVTLTLNGDGGKDEATWRVETDLMKEVNVPDVYIGYRAGARTTIQATGDYEGMTISSLSSSKEIRVVSYGNNPGEIVVEALNTNTHDYTDKTHELQYTVNGVTKKSRVIQVPRLVDPIAIYKKATNVEKRTIEVKAYNPVNRKYEILESVGPWSAIIQSASATVHPSQSSWFKISPKDNDAEAVYNVSDTIHGYGPVIFDYEPLSENNYLDRASNANLTAESELDNSDKARYGVILVKYHNNACPHEIFLRQGYQPATFSGTVWPMFNCTGLDNDGNAGITTYPTETGWLFKGGSNIGMHPYEPGYEVLPQTIECSDGRSRKFVDIPSELSAWVENPGSDDAKQGPCPDGYTLASAPQIDNLFNNTEVYTGFVYDDDYPVGGSDKDLPYGYHFGEGGNMEITEGTGNHCNPAKGSLFVSNGDDKANIFFTFGKGILTAHTDPNLIDEIGVGHRGIDHVNTWNQGYLKYFEFLNWSSGGLENHTYGAFYWGATRFSKTINGSDIDRFSRVCVSYDILTNNPYYVDLLTETGHQGIQANLHGNFIRCVRSESGGGGGDEYITFTPSATFTWRNRPFNGWIIVSCDGEKEQKFLIMNGVISGTLTLPSNASVKLSYAPNPGRDPFTIENVNVSDLRNSNKIINF